MKRVLIFVLIVLALAVIYSLGASHFPTLGDLKGNLGMLSAWVSAHPVRSVVYSLLLYIVAAAFSVPIVTLLTLGSGALFGFWGGLAIASFGSSIGATLAFLAARTLLHDAVQSRFGNRLASINDGFRRDGAFYLLTLRLLPIFPFFLVNLTMGLTPIRTWTFYWVGQLGMLAGTAVYVNAGTQLAMIDSLWDVASPSILVSLALIGLLPLVARIFLRLRARRKVYAGWTRPQKFDRNLVVIGGGSAGLVSAYIGATVKAKVTLIEAHKMGGDCLNYGCIPSKALIRSARLAAQIRHADEYGLIASEPQFSFKRVMQRIGEVIATIAPHDSAARYEGLGVEVLQGYARIKDPWTVEVTLADGTVMSLTTRSIIIASGASPLVPPLPGIETSGYVTSDTLWDRFGQLDAAPRRLVVLGGGPVGCELAQSFARLGSHVTQIEMGARLLIREDCEVSEYALEALRADGVEVLTSHKALSFETEGAEKLILVEHEGVQRKIAFDELICAVGRAPRLNGFGLEALGIPTGKTVETNDYLETIYPNIYAAGDVAGPYQFTHVAAHQAWYASVNALFGTFKRFKADYRVIPQTTFIDPEAARVGLNEQEANAQNIPYEVTRYGIDDLDRAIADGTARGVVKILTVPGKDKILGVTIIGTHAGDLLAEFVLAMKHGLGLNKILQTIHTYPTLSEANKYAAGEWRRAHISPALQHFLARFHRFMRGGTA